MALDINKIAPEARTEYIRIGKQYSSADTLAQADKTLGGLAAHGALLVGYGFGPLDAAQLSEAREQLIAAGGDRETKRSTVTSDAKAFVKAVRGGKNARRRARAVLQGAQRTLSESTEAGVAEAVREVATALQRTSTAGADTDALVKQLDLLQLVLTAVHVSDAAASRGGPDAIGLLIEAGKTLRAEAAKRPGKPGTPEQTQKLDVLEGIIVKLARHARAAARTYADEKGDPAVAAAFELIFLQPAATSSSSGGGSGGVATPVVPAASAAG